MDTPASGWLRQGSLKKLASDDFPFRSAIELYLETNSNHLLPYIALFRNACRYLRGIAVHEVGIHRPIESRQVVYYFVIITHETCSMIRSDSNY
jgi:hypothetical protein